MDRKFYRVGSSAPFGFCLCELCDGTLYILNGSQRTGVAAVRGDPMRMLRDLGKSHLGETSEIFIDEISFKIGEYYPSIARPIFQEIGSFKNIEFNNQIYEVRQFEREISILISEIEECFDVVSFEEDNFKAFGFVFQNIIHLSCIGIETLFVKIFHDNQIPIKRPTFRDFRNLNNAMMLSDYSVLLPKYPRIREFSPFSKWAGSGTFQFPPWQLANNQLKHARKSNFKSANLHTVIESICAFVVLYVAVFGDDVFSENFEGDLQYFSLSKRPAWTLDQNYFCATDSTWAPSRLLL